MRRFLCALIFDHTPERIEWESVGQADRLVKRCQRCGRVEPLTPEQGRILARRDFNMRE